MQLTVADFSGISQPSVSRILVRVTAALAKRRQDFIKMPENELERRTAAAQFFNIAKFPLVIGSIDCTHVKIESPGGSDAEQYRNRKGFFSYNVQTIASAELKILNIVARWPGSCHDQTIFNNSNISMRLQRGDFGKYIIVGDSGYRNTRYLATPFLSVDNPAKNLFNESQIRTRNVVERSYGVLKRRFPVLSLGMRFRRKETTRMVIVACAILHNIAIEERDAMPFDEIEGLAEILANVAVPHEPFDEGRRRSQATQELCAREYLASTYFQNMIEIAETID